MLRLQQLMLIGITTTIKEMMEDRHDAYKKAEKLQNKYYKDAYRHEFGVRTCQVITAAITVNRITYYGSHYYDNGYDRGGGLVGGILLGSINFSGWVLA